MRYPLWIVNFSLLIMSVFACFFAATFRHKTKAWQSLNPSDCGVLSKISKRPTVDIKRIYENDIFNTFVDDHQENITEKESTVEFPKPPTASPVIIPAIELQPFLAALNVSLKGIIITNDGANDSALILDKATNKEESFKVGDFIEDAQIIKIFKNKILLIRSNGQQESLYLSEKESLQDPIVIEENNNWIHIVKKINEFTYYIDPFEFSKIVTNLAMFIDIFDITTVYEKGTSIGCRIGTIRPSSLACVCGFQTYDIIDSIDKIKINNTDKRFAVYEKITSLKINDSMLVSIKRSQSNIEIKYIFKDLDDDAILLKDNNKNNNSIANNAWQLTDEQLYNEKVRILNEKYKHAKVEKDIILQQRKYMLKNGKMA